MSPWDYVAATNILLAALFLVLHGVMVGNPQYGWQPKSWVVRTFMFMLAICLMARAYTIIQLHQPVVLAGRIISPVLAALFFTTWLDMIVSSWKAEMEKRTHQAEDSLATVVMEQVGTASAEAAVAASAAAEQSASNGQSLDRIVAAVSIFEPAPTEFKDKIGYHPGEPEKDLPAAAS